MTLKHFIALAVGIIALFLAMHQTLKIINKQPNYPIEEQHPAKILEIVSIDNSLSEFERSAIQEATNIWQYDTNGIASFIIIKDSEREDINREQGQKVQFVVIKPIDSSDEKIRAIDESGGGGETLGLYDNSNIVPIIWIVKDRIQSQDLYLEVLLHELGHSIGLSHIRHKGSIMYPSVNGDLLCLTEYDLQEFCNIYDCNIDKMKFCRGGLFEKSNLLIFQQSSWCRYRLYYHSSLRKEQSFNLSTPNSKRMNIISQRSLRKEQSFNLSTC